MDRRFNAHFVMDVDKGGVSLFESQSRAGDISVDGHAQSRFPCDVDLLLGDREIVFNGAACVHTGASRIRRIAHATAVILVNKIKSEPLLLAKRPA